jgi:hypothetical protein
MWTIIVVSFIFFFGLGYWCCNSNNKSLPDNWEDTNYMLAISNNTTHKIEKICFVKNGTQNLELVQYSDKSNKNDVVSYWQKTH